MFSKEIMPYEHIKYSELNSRQKEIFNFQKLSGVLADYGFNCIKLADDWQGADFLAYHIDGDTTVRVQLKGRISIDQKYLDKNLHIAFPFNGDWFLIPHDHLVEVVGVHTNWLNTSAWNDAGIYNSKSPSRALMEAIDEYRIQ